MYFGTGTCDLVARPLRACPKRRAFPASSNHLPLCPGGSYLFPRALGAEWGWVPSPQEILTPSLLGRLSLNRQTMLAAGRVVAEVFAEFST